MEQTEMSAELAKRKLDDLQSIVGRMSENSFRIKTWNVSIIAGIFAFLVSADKYNPFLVIAPNCLFGFLDIYYLALEKCFRKQYRDHINNLQDHNEATLHVESPGIKQIAFNILRSVVSPSVFLFYSGFIIASLFYFWFV